MDRLELIHKGLRTNKIDFETFVDIYEMATSGNLHNFLLIDDRGPETVF